MALFFTFGVSLSIVLHTSAAVTFARELDASQANSKPHTRTKKKRIVKRKMKDSKRAVPPGVWGGEGIRLVIDTSTSTLEYACAAGEITEKFTIDANGDFELQGVHMNQTPGPTYVDRPPQRNAARYKGRLLGKTMSLKVELTDAHSLVGDFTLELGKSGRIRKCR